MKKFFLSVIAATLLPFTAAAFSHLVITWQNDETTSIAFADLVDISFTGNDVIFTYVGGTTQSYAYTEIGQLTFAGKDGIAVARTDGKLSVSPNPTSGYCRISGLGSASAVCTVYTLGGNLVLQSVVSDGDTVDLNALAKGLYILMVNGESFKIEKK